MIKAIARMIRRFRMRHKWRIVERWHNRCTINGDPVGFVHVVGEENGFGDRRARILSQPRSPDKQDWTGGGAWRAAMEWVSEPQLKGEVIANLRKAKIYDQIPDRRR